ncbi:hypothetical protein M8494_19430 [Serratia ureilytica]
MKFYGVRTASGRYFSGTGDFVIAHSRLDGGGGGAGIQTLVGTVNNKLKDGDFTFSTKPFGWEVTGGTTVYLTLRCRRRHRNRRGHRRR